MKKWLSMLLTVMLLINSVFTPIAALAEEVGAETVEKTETPALFPEGYASVNGSVRVFGYRDTDGDGKTERVEIGTISAGGYVYVSGAYPDGRWVKIAFAVQTASGGKVEEGTAVIDNLTHVDSVGGGSGLSYGGHPLSFVSYSERVYTTPEVTEEPAEEQEPEVSEPEVTESETTESDEEKETEAEEPEATEPAAEETEAPEVGGPAAPQFPMIAVATVPTEAEATEAPAEEPDVEETEAPEVGGPAVPEFPMIEVATVPVEAEATEAPAEEPEVEVTEEPVEEPEVEVTEEPVEEPEVEVTEEPVEEPEVEV
ncbi:MAG: hypothetical protein J1E43_12570, partial [Christensenellaceae bacterium]|nr:hypothetical protein [Christensenellaceae bacterium]